MAEIHLLRETHINVGTSKTKQQDLRIQTCDAIPYKMLSYEISNKTFMICRHILFFAYSTSLGLFYLSFQGLKKNIFPVNFQWNWMSFPDPKRHHKSRFTLSHPDLRISSGVALAKSLSWMNLLYFANASKCWNKTCTLSVYRPTDCEVVLEFLDI